MTIFKKIMKKIRERYTGEPENLVVAIDPKVVLHPERYYDMIKRSFEETGCFTVHSANCIPLILGDKNYHVVTEHFNIYPEYEEIRYGWSDISEITSSWAGDGTYQIKFTVPPYELPSRFSSDEDLRTKRFAVIEKVKMDPETGAGRATWYGDFDTRAEAENFIKENSVKNVDILDLEDSVRWLKNGGSE